MLWTPASDFHDTLTTMLFKDSRGLDVGTRCEVTGTRIVACCELACETDRKLTFISATASRRMKAALTLAFCLLGCSNLHLMFSKINTFLPEE